MQVRAVQVEDHCAHVEALCADLTDKSDVFAIPALNKDVKTFDQTPFALGGFPGP